MAILSHKIVDDRNHNIKDKANCDLFFDNLESFYDHRRIIWFYRIEYAFAHDLLVSHASIINRNRETHDAVRRDFRRRLEETFENLKRNNDDFSKNPGQHRRYENILNQQRACIFESQVYLKPHDLRLEIHTQTRPSELYQIFIALTFPFLFEKYCIQNRNVIPEFWESGDWTFLEGQTHADKYYLTPRTSHLKTLFLVFVAKDKRAPCIQSIYLCERIMDRIGNKRKSGFPKIMETTSVVPIFRIEWNDDSYGFKYY